MDDASAPERNPANKLSYSAYHRRDLPAEDAEITRSGPGTPLGEYLRRFWQPVCMSEQLRDVPHKIRIMSEDLIAFRDKRGKVGVMQRHCAHRGASLEFGIIGERGIRCPYHAFHYDVDGTLLDAPGEPDNGAKLSQSVCQGAYPAFERDGLVFAYMGPPDEMPPFPEWDALDKHDGTRLVPFSNVFPCNWLQVLDNIADQVHTSLLHNPAILFDGDPPADLDIDGFTLKSFSGVPVLDFTEVRNGTSMAFIAGRRMSDERVWWRINECALPNYSFHAYLFENGAEIRKFHRVHMIRWYVPVDDENSIMYGYRMFGDAIDPFLFASAEVGPGMHDEPGDPQSVAAIQLVTQGRTRAPEVVRIGRCEIHQIGGVGHERRDLAIAELLHEALHVGLRERLSLPLTGVLDEDLNGITGQVGASRDSPEDTACDGNMGTE